MFEVQKFALDNIYCAPSQDKQYRFSLIRITKKFSPIKRVYTVYNRQRNLPNTSSFFHVYVIGNIPASILNLIKKNRNWVRDQWRNVQDDMNTRNFIMQVYDNDGVVFPRKNIYYSAGTDELIIAIEIDTVMTSFFDVEKCAFMRVYSNEYFNTTQFNSQSDTVGIHCESAVVRSNPDKVSLQNKIEALELKGGKTLVYVNGYYADKVTLNIPNGSFVEYVYDRSLLTIEHLKLSDMRTFHSEKDSRIKYLVYRERTTDFIQYEDDLEVYLTGNNQGRVRGLYYYQHKHFALTNVTDKDFALDSQYVNNQAQTLSNVIGGGINDKTVVMLTRRSSLERKLVYSSLKLHELYKLPHNKQLDVINNVGFMLPEYRVESLENSAYFKIASANRISDVSNLVATEAVGYNGVNYYFGYTPSKVDNTLTVEVPVLYRKPSTAYEYDQEGKLIGHFDTLGPLYVASTSDCKYVEFIRGQDKDRYFLFEANQPVTLEDGEYRVISAFHDAAKRITTWEDITHREEVVVSDNTLTVTDEHLGSFRVVYLDDIFCRDIGVSLHNGVLIFPINALDERGNGLREYGIDIPYDSLEVFLNGYRLTYNVDFTVSFPNVAICNKTYIDYTKDCQDVHVRLTGFNIHKDKLNAREINGFVHHGALTRNSYYDIRDDRVFSIFVGGKLVCRDRVRFSENDNTVRLLHPCNGIPYSVTEHLRSIKEVTGLDTLPYYNKNIEQNERISELYNIIYPEQPIDPLNAIGDHHYLYSTLIAEMIHDLLSGAIAPSVYTTPYNDTLIQNLINDRYKLYFDLDPIRLNLPDNIVEIHPHSGNTIIEVNLFQYRFLLNVIRIITGGHPERINLSGYLTVNGNLSEDFVPVQNTPGGIVVI